MRDRPVRQVREEDAELEPPEPPNSLREIVVDGIADAAYGDWVQRKPIREFTEDRVEEGIRRLCEYIERQALAVYKSNEPWALKAWVYSNILQDVVASEDTDSLVEGLVSPVVDWQDRDFDPIGHFKETMEIEGLSVRTKEAYLQTACRVVSKLGRKPRYSDDDLREYLKWARNRYPKNTSTYYHECERLLQFLRRLPGGKNTELPVKMPKLPAEYYQPTLTEEDIETLIWSCATDDVSPELVIRLMVATIYGGRLGELAALKSEDISVNGNGGTVYLHTLKGGQRKPQPIPDSLVPLFQVPLEPVPRMKLAKQLKKVCKRAGIFLPPRAGFHSIRRRVATTVSEVEHSDLNVHNFMRWSVPRQFSMLARYKQTPVEATDTHIIQLHPYVKKWEEACPYILGLNASYHPKLHNT